ncbi:ABC transporter permease [Rickettsiales endosymbiont of Peranema trichophorum]|uniref:ABC transporter permease n=1 Tax=Rickettsiales endosymbiont of Peranema trichophorum TaxID=2486577 RepID=UPI001A927200|nr:ABC transporter permease [Rickettsiales endosymbiont of Peranema trichophorum]
MSVSEIAMSLEIGLIYGIIAIGIYLTFRVIDFPDLTCDGSFALGGAVTSVLIVYGYPPFFTLVIAMFAGGIAGSVSGVLYSYCRVTDLLAGILVSFMLYSVNIHVMGGTPNISLLDFKTIFTDTDSVQALLLLATVICIGVTYILYTDFGLALRSMGQNRLLAHHSGISVKKMIILGLALSNGLIALGGALFAQHQCFADVGGGVGTVIVGLASVMIGERLFVYRGVFVGVVSCIAGSILYRIVISLCLHSDVLGLQTQDLNLVTGIMVVAIMYMPRRVRAGS